MRNYQVEKKVSRVEFRPVKNNGNYTGKVSVFLHIGKSGSVIWWAVLK